ncbi:hypothetical protein [Candidatus Igneacidithiobacillus taiwanensis]|uniref:hypothetical protein n=1 Tax=Candidatus Igneacidithiobacillus taiwanensis TaxID=1945924 RepID=UPI00289B0789|nr:hypothetical protein [Candidatus Igneacidithiobacillus taiwanensis]
MDDTRMQSYLQSLKAGDKVFIKFGATYSQFSVIRTTPTTIIVGIGATEKVFQRKTGNVRGKRKHDDPKIILPTREMVEEMELTRIRDAIRDALPKLTRSSLGPLREAAAILGIIPS